MGVGPPATGAARPCCPARRRHRRSSTDCRPGVAPLRVSGRPGSLGRGAGRRAVQRRHHVVGHRVAAIDDRRRPRIGRPRLGLLVVGHRLHAQRQHLVDLGAVEEVADALGGDGRVVVEDHRRGEHEVAPRRRSDEHRPAAVLRRTAPAAAGGHVGRFEQRHEGVAVGGEQEVAADHRVQQGVLAGAASPPGPGFSTATVTRAVAAVGRAAITSACRQRLGRRRRRRRRSATSSTRRRRARHRRRRGRRRRPRPTRRRVGGGGGSARARGPIASRGSTSTVAVIVGSSAGPTTPHWKRMRFFAAERRYGYST